MEKKDEKKDQTNMSMEEFLHVYNKAHKKNNISLLNYLFSQYPDIAKQAFDKEIIEKHSDPADEEMHYRFPIMMNSKRMTERRVLDMVAYLTGKIEASKSYADYLRENIEYHLVFNYETNRYQRDYAALPLWENFFMGQCELRTVLVYRSIQGLEELAYRAGEYFEDYQRKYRGW